MYTNNNTILEEAIFLNALKASVICCHLTKTSRQGSKVGILIKFGVNVVFKKILDPYFFFIGNGRYCR